MIKKIVTWLSGTCLPAFFICLMQFPCKADQLPADSRVLFVGEAAASYMNCFMGICSKERTVTPLTITASSFNTTNVLHDVYAGINEDQPTSDLQDKLNEGYDYIVFIPSEHHALAIPELSMEAARLLKSVTRKTGSTIMIAMPWSSVDAVTETATIEDHVYRICDALGLPCVPAGLSWMTVLEDRSIRASACAPGSPSDYAEYTLAATLYIHFFEKKPDNSRYRHGKLSSFRQKAIIDHCYTAWEEAKTAVHYTGDYISGFCAPWAEPHDLGKRTWVAMGTSTENGTRRKLNIIMERAGFPNDGIHMNGYDYDGENNELKQKRYFDGILDNAITQAMVQSNNFDFAFGRILWDDYSGRMDKLREYDPDEGGDTRFIGFSKHWPRAPHTTIRNIGSASEQSAQAAATDSGFQIIPNFIGFGRAWLERPDLILLRKDNTHMSDLGTYLQAAMIYTLVTGGKHPASDYTDWKPDEFYILQMGYKTVLELGGLKHVDTAPIAFEGGTVEAVQDTAVPLPINGMDLDHLPLSVKVISGPGNGRLSGSGTNLTYTPDPGFTGVDHITYKLNNGAMNSLAATTTITVLRTPTPSSEPGS